MKATATCNIDISMYGVTVFDYKHGMDHAVKKEHPRLIYPTGKILPKTAAL
jgi:hypothetical protein